MKITAAVSRSPDSPFTLESVDLDEPRPDEVLVRISATGLCHTDLSSKSRMPGPAVLGHEGAGVVEAVGAQVAGIAPGDHVLLSYRSCGECAQCRGGHRSYCSRSALLNSSGGRADGTATLSQNGIRLFGSFFGQSSFAQYALAVTVVDPVASRRAKAVELGASQIVDPSSEDVAAAVQGATHALDTTGLGHVLAAALSALESRGILAVVGLGARHVTIDITDLLLNGKMIRGCIEGDANPTEFIPKLLTLHAQGKFPMDAIVRRYDARDIETAVADSRSGEAIKPVLVW
jgi:aryl-alcohol dehydrogenase